MGVPFLPPPPLPMFEADSQDFSSAPSDLRLKILGPPSAGTIQGPSEEGYPSQTPLRPPPNTSLETRTLRCNPPPAAMHGYRAQSHIRWHVPWHVGCAVQSGEDGGAGTCQWQGLLVVPGTFVLPRGDGARCL